MNKQGNTILITGGATGIGFGLAQRYIQNGNKVIICGRREDKLKEAADQLTGLITYTCDLESEQGRIALYEQVATDHPDVNVLINNAGIQHWMDISDPAFMTRARQEIEINVLAPLHLTNLFIQLPSITTIANVTSGLAFVPLTKVMVYSATKAFMRSASLSLRHILQQRNIEVIEIIPPALNTDLGGKGIHDAYPPVSEFIDSIFTQLEEGKNELSFGTSAFSSKANSEAIMPIFQRMNS